MSQAGPFPQYVDRSELRGRVSVLTGRATTIVDSSLAPSGSETFDFAGIAKTAQEANPGTPSPAKGTLKRFTVRIPSNSLTVASTTITIMIDGVASALVITIAAGQTGNFSDTVDIANILADQRIGVRCVVGAGGIGTIAIGSWSIVLDPLGGL